MAERKKWELSEAVKEDSEVLTLQGYRQMVALAGLRDFLRSIRKDCSPEAMETWPLGGTYFVSSILCPGDRFVSRETTEKLRLGPRVKSLKSRTIKTMLRVHERISAEPAAEVCIRQLDDQPACPRDFEWPGLALGQDVSPQEPGPCPSRSVVGHRAAR